MLLHTEMATYQSVLLVEDDEVDVLNVRRAFRKKGFSQHLHLAENGLEALKILDDQENLEPYPDLILLDLNMPKMDGFEFLRRRLNEEHLRDIDVYVMSTSSAETDISKAMELGAKGYLVKPLYTDRFADELEKVLR